MSDQFVSTGDAELDGLMQEKGFVNIQDLLGAILASPDQTLAADPEMQALQAAYAIEAQLFHEANAVDMPSLGKAALMELESLSDLYADTRGWSTTGRSYQGYQQFGVPVDPISDSARVKLVKQAYHTFYRDPLARNIIRSYVHLTVGKGIQVRFRGNNAKSAQERWSAIAKCNDFELKYRDYLALCYLLGEWFIVRHPRVNNKYWKKGKPRSDRKALMNHLQSIPPDEIVLSSITPLELDSIYCSKGNREIPMYYGITIGDAAADALDAEKAPSSGWPRGFWADDITHLSVDALMGGRGISILAPVMKHLSYYRLFQLDRVTLNAIRARIPLIRKVVGGPTRKRALSSAMQQDALPTPGTIFVVDEKEQWDFPSTPQDGASANRDGRSILLMVAAGVSLPEFLVSGDAGGANYASQLIASSPLVSMFEDLRSRFGLQLCQLIEEVCGDEPEIIFPEIVLEDLLKVVQGNSILYRDGVLSRPTYAARAGLDYEYEQSLRQADAESDPYSLYPEPRKDPDDSYTQDYTGATPPQNPTQASGDPRLILPGAAIGQAKTKQEPPAAPPAAKE